MQLVRQRGQEVTLPGAGLADGHHVDGIVDEGTRSEALHLLAEDRREAVQLQRAEGLLQRQPGLVQQAGGAALVALGTFGLDQLVQERFVGQPTLGGLEREGGKRVGHRR